jgi:hypothetical protein
MSVDNTSSQIVEEIRGILRENEKKLPSLVKGIEIRMQGLLRKLWRAIENFFTRLLGGQGGRRRR